MLQSEGVRVRASPAADWVAWLAPTKGSPPHSDLWVGSGTEDTADIKSALPNSILVMSQNIESKSLYAVFHIRE